MATKPKLSSPSLHTPPPQQLTLDDGETIAYHYTLGKSPGIVFLAGFKSDMTGGKAMALESFCKARGQAFLRFDYFGHGASSGRFEDGCIGRWADDTVHVLDSLTNGPQILVGSSMGGWIMLLAALRRAERVVGLVGIAAAPDFTEDLLLSSLSESQQQQLQTHAYFDVPNCYEAGEPYKITQALLNDGREHLLLRQEIAIDVPVRLIHGIKDEDVPWQTSQNIAAKLRSTDVEVTLVKNGDHRLSEPCDLARLERTVSALIKIKE